MRTVPLRCLTAAFVAMFGGCVTLERVTPDEPAPVVDAQAPFVGPPAPDAVPTAGEEQSAEDSRPRVRVPADDAGSDRQPSVDIRGRIQADAIFANQSPSNKAAIGNVDNAVGFRRARIGVQGHATEQVGYIAEFDFAGGDIAFRDVYVQLGELPYVRRSRVGHMREPFSLEGFTSSNNFPFTERSQMNSLDPARNWGVGAFSYSENERLVFQCGAFRSGTSSATGGDTGDGDDMAYTARLTGLPWSDDDGRKLMHVGGAFSQRMPKNDLVTINTGPQNSLTNADNPGSPFVPVIMFPAKQYQLYNAQWALVLGSLSFQAEWTGAMYETIGTGSIFFNGSYAFVSYFLTGEHRKYDRPNGAFGITQVNSPFVCRSGNRFSMQGCGAWELLARIAYTNFDSLNLPPSAAGELQGDRETVLTFGLNWYLCDHARFMFNYAHAIAVIPGFGATAADGFFLRTSVFW